MRILFPPEFISVYQFGNPIEKTGDAENYKRIGSCAKGINNYHDTPYQNQNGNDVKREGYQTPFSGGNQRYDLLYSRDNQNSPQYIH